ncbi:hypothetical protein BSKO_05318 [Bryopsis sp. KO-2023]|nr:hypothetical protein BSKO_05318 [Bryopsis sp. KO-2023]
MQRETQVDDVRPTQSSREVISKVEKVCGRDVGRGTGPLATHAKGNLFSACASIANHPSPSIGIITGFFIPGASPPACETDGPIGAAFLSRALAQVNVPVRVVTDSLSENAVMVALNGIGAREGQIDLDVVPIGDDAAIDRIVKRWKDVDVTHVVSIERAGPAADGRTYNMRGHDISDTNAPLHNLFDRADHGWVTVGIGDGGNELGMGSLPRDLISANVNLGAKIACVVPCDHLVVCGVSNWGAWGLVAGLCVVKEEWRRKMLEGFRDGSCERCLKECVRKGPAVDGVSGEQRLSVDGLDWKQHEAMLEEILNVITE